jgi:hypothetical protein
MTLLLLHAVKNAVERMNVIFIRAANSKRAANASAWRALVNHSAEKSQL